MSATGFFSKDWAWLSCVPLAMAFTALAGLILGFPDAAPARATIWRS